MCDKALIGQGSRAANRLVSRKNIRTLNEVVNYEKEEVMKRTLILAIGLLMLMSVSSFASETRTMVMGDNHMVLVDDHNMFMFPGRVNNYPNLALGEFGYGDEFYNFGLTWQFNDDNPWVLGTFVSRPTGYGPVNFSGSDMAKFDEYYYPTASPSGDDDLSSTYPRRVLINYGRQLAGQNFGFSLGIARQSWEYDQAEQLADSTHVGIAANHANQSFSQYDIGIGMTEATSGQWDVALHLMMGGWTNEDDSGKSITEPDGFSDITLNARYFWVRNPKVTFVPHITFTTGSRGVTDFNVDLDSAGDDQSRKWSHTVFDLGFGMHYTPAPNMLAVLDIGVSSEKTKYEQTGAGYAIAFRGEFTNTEFILPYLKIGFEGEVFSWMDFRAGATTHMWSSKDKSESDWGPDYMYNTPSNATYMGFGFHWGRLYLDTYSDPELLMRGPDFVSGDYDGGDMNWMVSLTYEMF